jgi:uncharacterized membrane protein YphA (DoxX/SURF4 family)
MPTPLHVEYVVTDPAEVGDAVAFVARVLADPLHLALVVGTAVAVAVAVTGYLRYRPFRADVAVLRRTLAGYDDLLPWLLRISLGMPLVAAGFAGYYFSPAVAVQARPLFVGLGFLLLFGLATRAVAAAALGAYLVALPAHPRLLLAGEFVGGLLAVILLGGGRPSADQVLQQVTEAPDTTYGRVDPVHAVASRFQAAVTPYRRLLPTLVRASLGLQFVYLGVVEKLANPGAGLAVVAKYDLTAVVPVAPGLWVVGAGLAEVAVGVALLAGLFTRATAGVAFALFTLTLFALPDDPVVAHLSLYGLVSVLVVTGGGPYSLDERLWRHPTGDDGEIPRGGVPTSN